MKRRKNTTQHRGRNEGTKEGTKEGAKEGAEEGAEEGTEEGTKEGTEEGAKAEEGAEEGSEEVLGIGLVSLNWYSLSLASFCANLLMLLVLHLSIQRIMTLLFKIIQNKPSLI